MKKSSRETYAYHEAGHMVAAWRKGVKIRRATIVPKDDYNGLVEHDSPVRGLRLDIESSDRTDLRIDKAVVICLAGPIAHRRFRPSSWRSYHGASDFNVASDLALRRNGSGEMATAYLKWIELQAIALIEGNWRYVELFAKHLLAKNTLAFSDIVAIFQEDTLARYGGHLPTVRVLSTLTVEEADITPGSRRTIGQPNQNS